MRKAVVLALLALGSAAFAQVTLNSPIGGERWPASTVHNIDWTSSVTEASDSINYSTDDGSTWQWVANVLPPTSPYAWTVPLPASPTCRVELLALDATGAVLDGDTSPGPFEILPVPSVIVTSPVGGERWNEKVLSSSCIGGKRKFLAK